MTTPGPSDRSTGAGRGPKPSHTLVCADCGTPNLIGASERGSPFCGKCGRPLAWVVDANERTFEIEAKAQPTVVIDLWAPWCGPCRFVSPILDEIAHEYAGRLKVIKVNVDENQGLARRFDAMSIPTMVVLRDGNVVNRIVGAATKERLAAEIVRHLKPPKSDRTVPAP